MRDILKTEELEIPDGVTVSIKSRVIVVTGPRGTLTKTVRHVNMDIRLIKAKSNKVTLAVWQAQPETRCLSSDNRSTHLQHDYRRDKGLSYLLCVALQWLNGPSRAFYTKCVRSTLTSPSTALSRKMVIDLKLGISWERRYDVLFHLGGSST